MMRIHGLPGHSLLFWFLLPEKMAAHYCANIDMLPHYEYFIITLRACQLLSSYLGRDILSTATWFRRYIFFRLPLPLIPTDAYGITRSRYLRLADSIFDAPPGSNFPLAHDGISRSPIVWYGIASHISSMITCAIRIFIRCWANAHDAPRHAYASPRYTVRGHIQEFHRIYI